MITETDVKLERITATVPAQLKAKALKIARARGLDLKSWLIILIERETERFEKDLEVARTRPGPGGRRIYQSPTDPLEDLYEAGLKSNPENWPVFKPE